MANHWVAHPVPFATPASPPPQPIEPAVEHTGDTQPETRLWEERGAFHGLQLHVDPHDMAPPYPHPRKLPPENPADGIEVFSESASSLNKELSFQAHSVLIDNYTSQWIFIPAAARFIPPYVIGMCVPLPRATQSAQYTFAAPPGFTQTAATSGQLVVTTWLAWMLGYSMGTVVGDGAGKGTVTTETVVSVASASATQLLAANPARKSAFFQNLGANNIALGPDNTVTATTGIILAPGATPPAGGGTFNDTSSVGAWFGRAATGPTNLLVVEVS